MNRLPDHLARYHRQILLPDIGVEGQRRLRDARALLVGCGALGTVIADALARAGIGALTIVDRDLVELTNLQRQVLFDERDVEQGMPKAEAAKRALNRINSEVRVEARVDDFNHRNAERYAADADLILDGLDNFETRYLLNDLAVKLGLPYIYGGAVGTTGMSLTILPRPRPRPRPRKGSREASSAANVTWTDEQSTPCLRCVFPEAPPPGTSPTCDTAGVLGPVVNMIASHQAAQAIKLLTGNLDALDRMMLSVDLWANETRRFDVAPAGHDPDCPCCGRGSFVYLEGATGSTTTSLCGRNAIQITPADSSVHAIDLVAMGRRLEPHGSFSANDFLLRGMLNAESGHDGTPIEVTLFPNGRAIIKGTHEPEVARTIYAKYIGA